MRTTVRFQSRGAQVSDNAWKKTWAVPCNHTNLGCGAKVGEQCRKHNGRLVSPGSTHAVRVRAFLETLPSAPEGGGI